MRAGSGRRASIFVACAAGLIATAAGTSLARAVTFETVIKNGDAVPGVAGATWNTTSNSFFATPGIDNSGNVAFRGQMTAGAGGVVAGANQAGYWYGGPGSLNLVARDGTAGPTLSNPNNWVHNSTAGGAGLSTSSPTIAPNGVMMAGSALNGAGATSSNNTAAWSGASNNLQLIAQRGTAGAPLPNGATHALFNSNFNFLAGWINNNAQTVIGSDLISDGNAGTDVVSGTWSATNLTNDSGFWLASAAGNALVAREGAATPIAGTIYGEMTLAANSAALNSSGQVAFVSGLRGTVGGVVATGSTGRNEQVLWTNAVPGGQLTAIARKADPVPGLSGVNYASGAAIAFFLGSQPFNNSGRMVFDAQFGTGAAPGTGNEAIMTSYNGNTNIVVRENTPAVGVPAATWNSFNGSNAKMRLNNNNTMIFTAGMSNTAGGTADDEGIWMTKIDAGGNATNTQLIAREGQAIPNASGLLLGGGLVASATPLLNNADQVVFLGTLTGTGVTTSNDQALFDWDANGGLSMLLREGDDASSSIAGLSGTMGNNTVTINPFSYSGLGTGEGGNMSLSDSGWLTLSVTLRTAGVNDINIVRTQIPEPSMLGAVGLGCLTLLRRARTRKRARRRTMNRSKNRALAGASAAMLGVAGAAGIAAAAPMYNIVDLGAISGSSASQGFRISPNGIATGRTFGTPFNTNAQAFSWTQGGGTSVLPIYVTSNPTRNFDVGNGVNNAGIVVGSGAVSASGTNPLPVMWTGGVPSQVPLPAGQTFGRANDINSSNVIVGSVNGGSNEIAFVASGANSSIVTTLTPNGSFFRTAFSINDAGTVVGIGADPNDAARNVPFIYDSVHNTASEVPSLPGFNGGIAFDVSEAGQIVGSESNGQAPGPAFYWSPSTGTVAIPLVAGTSSNIARGVNSAGWVVGNAGGQFSVPWLWDGANAYRLQDLLPGGSGWDLSQNTSNAAMGISEDGTIVGTGMIGGNIHAYAMIPAVPEPTTLGAIGVFSMTALRRRRRMRD